jgi:hypothetical protein
LIKITFTENCYEILIFFKSVERGYDLMRVPQKQIISVIKELQCEHRNEILSFIKGGEILHRLSDYGRRSEEGLCLVKTGAFISQTAPSIPITLPDYFPPLHH